MSPCLFSLSKLPKHRYWPSFETLKGFSVSQGLWKIHDLLQQLLAARLLASADCPVTMVATQLNCTRSHLTHFLFCKCLANRSVNMQTVMPPFPSSQTRPAPVSPVQPQKKNLLFSFRPLLKTNLFLFSFSCPSVLSLKTYSLCSH